MGTQKRRPDPQLEEARRRVIAGGQVLDLMRQRGDITDAHVAEHLALRGQVEDPTSRYWRRVTHAARIATEWADAPAEDAAAAVQALSVRLAELERQYALEVEARVLASTQDEGSSS